MSEKRFRFKKERTENFFTEKGVFYNNERPMGANEIIDLLNSLSDENEQLQQEKEYYRKYALLYLQSFDLYSDNFIEIMKSIEGDEFAEKMLKDREEIIEALKKEGLYE